MAETTEGGEVDTMQQVDRHVRDLAVSCARDGVRVADLSGVPASVREEVGAYLASLIIPSSKGVVAEQEVAGASVVQIAQGVEGSERKVIEIDEKQYLQRFKAFYDSDRFPQADRDKCSWQEIESRLLRNNGRYLKLAVAMEKGGILFGVDKDGNPLIADGGDGLMLTGMDYHGVRRAVYYDESGDNSTGYEMFPMGPQGRRRTPSDPFDKSQEIQAFEKFINGQLVGSRGMQGQLACWIDTGLGLPPGIGLYVLCNGYGYGGSCVYGQSLGASGPTIGTKRLLRVKVS